MSVREISRLRALALLVAAPLLVCSCQAPIRTCQPMELEVAERDSGATFVTREAGRLIRAAKVYTLTGRSARPRFSWKALARFRWKALVARDGTVHLFLLQFTRKGVPRYQVIHRKHQSGSWSDFGSIFEAQLLFGIDAVETVEGRFFLIASPGYVLAGRESVWEEVVQRLDSPSTSGQVSAVADGQGNVHVLYQGLLRPGEMYMTHFPHGTQARKLFHASYCAGRWTKGTPTAGRGRYSPAYFEVAAGPAGSVYALFQMTGIALKDPPIALALSAYEGGEWRGPFRLLGDPTSAEWRGVKTTALPWPGTPHVAVDKEGVCHVVWGNAYIQFQDGACTKPWIMLDDAYAAAILTDREDRLVVFLVQEEKLVARVRDERGWSEPFEVASANAFPILGNDGNMYLVWTDFVKDPENWAAYDVDICLQRIVFEEVRPSSP